MSSTPEKNDERIEHFYEAQYLTWRQGGNPDRISWDQSDNDFYDGREPDYTASREIRRERELRQARREAEGLD